MKSCCTPPLLPGWQRQLAAPAVLYERQKRNDWRGNTSWRLHGKCAGRYCSLDRLQAAGNQVDTWWLMTETGGGQTLFTREVLEAAGVPLILNLSFNTLVYCSFNTLVYCHNLVALQSAESAKLITATEPSHNISPPTGLEQIGGRWEDHSKNICRLKKKPSK